MEYFGESLFLRLLSAEINVTEKLPVLQCAERF